jgi:hypothetical protein
VLDRARAKTRILQRQFRTVVSRAFLMNLIETAFQTSAPCIGQENRFGANDVLQSVQGAVDSHIHAHAKEKNGRAYWLARSSR